VVSQPCFHRWRHPQTLVYPTEIVVGEVQSARRFQIVELLGEGIRQPRESPDRHTHREVLPLNITSRDVAHVRPTVTYFYYRLHYRCRGVAPSRVMLPVIAIKLYDLSEVGLSCEYILNPTPIKVEAIGAQLQAMIFRDPAVKIVQELVGGFAVPLADRIGRNQFRVGINANEHPCIPEFSGIIVFHVALFLANECPDFVALNVLAAEILHPRVHQVYAALPGKNEQTKDRVAVQVGNALDSANAGAFDQELNRQQSLIFGDDHRSEEPLVLFRVGLATLWATETLQAITVFPELLAHDIAVLAIHETTLQQANAVCQQ
jgi:hypothetical protein